MNPDLEHLIVLQAQDTELKRLRGELAELPGRLKAAEALLAAAEDHLRRHTEAIAQEHLLQRREELEAASTRTRLQRLRRSLDEATSATQVSAFEHQISFAEAALAALEECELASLERSETLEGDMGALQAAVANAQRDLASTRDGAAARQAGHEQSLAGIERERKALRQEIAPDWLGTYDRLARAKGTAVAEALGSATVGKCSACQMAVRPQRWHNLVGHDHDDEIFPCETCGRLLFWDPRRDTPKPWLAGERFAAAAGKGDLR